MAKKINITLSTNNTPFASGGVKLSKSIAIDKIEDHPKFKSLFNIDGDLLDRISNSMSSEGFDNSQPIHIWKTADDNDTVHFYLIDGYTRVSAARIAKINLLPCYEHEFETMEDAYLYALSLQMNRRNIESNELYRNILELLDTDFIRNSSGRKQDYIAKILGVSPRTVAKAIYVEKNASDEIKEELNSGVKSLNQAYKDSQKKKESNDENTANEEKECSEIESEDFYESEADGNPAPVVFNHSDGVERSKRNPWETDEYDQRLKERYMEGYSEGFTKAAYFVLGEIIKGKTPKEIWEDERLSDLSPSQIVKVELPKENEDLVLGL